MSELDDALEADETFEYDTFSVDSLDRANFAMRRLANAQRRIDEKNELALNEARKLSDWANRATKSDRETVTFFTAALQDYMMRVRAESGEKSISLPDGEIHSRSVPSKAEVQDVELALKWMLENQREGWIRTKESVNLEALKSEVTIQGEAVVDNATGEIIEGLVGVQSQVSVKVDVSPPE